MALYTIKTKNCGVTVHGKKIENGMSVEISSSSPSPLGNPQGLKDIQEAFLKKYGIDLKKSDRLNPSYLTVEKK